MTNHGDNNRKIAIICCSLDQRSIEREKEKIADGEVEEVAVAVKEALQSWGLGADILHVQPGKLEVLREYAWVFSLIDNVSGHDYLEYEITRSMEEMGLGFTGASAMALKTCLDKPAAKAIFLQKGLLTPAFTMIRPGEKIETGLTFPLFVKPARVDGSVGITSNSQVNSQAQLKAEVMEIHRVYQQPALVEEYIEGRDISAAIIGNGETMQALPLSEVTYRPEFVGPRVLTYDASWVEGSQAYANNDVICPCLVDPETSARMMDIAQKAAHALGCADYTRIDFRLKGTTPYVLEVNPNPCIHPHGAGFVRASQEAGMDYHAMIRRILQESMRRHGLSGNPIFDPDAQSSPIARDYSLNDILLF